MYPNTKKIIGLNGIRTDDLNIYLVLSLDMLRSWVRIPSEPIIFFLLTAHISYSSDLFLVFFFKNVCARWVSIQLPFPPLTNPLPTEFVFRIKYKFHILDLQQNNVCIHVNIMFFSDIFFLCTYIKIKYS